MMIPLRMLPSLSRASSAPLALKAASGMETKMASAPLSVASSPAAENFLLLYPRNVSSSLINSNVASRSRLSSSVTNYSLKIQNHSFALKSHLPESVSRSVEAMVTPVIRRTSRWTNLHNYLLVESQIRRNSNMRLFHTSAVLLRIDGKCVMCQLEESARNQNRTSNNEQNTAKDQERTTKTENLANNEPRRECKEQQTPNMGMGQLKAHLITTESANTSLNAESDKKEQVAVSKDESANTSLNAESDKKEQVAVSKDEDIGWSLVAGNGLNNFEIFVLPHDSEVKNLDDEKSAKRLSEMEIEADDFFKDIFKDYGSTSMQMALSHQEPEKAHNLGCFSVNRANRVNGAIRVNGVNHANGLNRGDVNGGDVNANSDAKKKAILVAKESKGDFKGILYNNNNSQDTTKSRREYPKVVDHPHETMGVGLWKDAFYRSEDMGGGGGGGGGGRGEPKGVGAVGEDNSKRQGGGGGEGMSSPLWFIAGFLSGAGIFALGFWSTGESSKQNEDGKKKKKKDEDKCITVKNKEIEQEKKDEDICCCKR